MSEKDCWRAPAREWRKIIYFRSAPFERISTALSETALGLALVEEVTLLVQESVDTETVKQTFGAEAMRIDLPDGAFSLAASASLIGRLRALEADAFVFFYNSADHRGYAEIEALGLLSGAREVVGVDIDHTLKQVDFGSYARHKTDPLLRWRNSRHASIAAENFIRYLRGMEQGDASVSNYPWFMYVEPTRNCNLRCPGCRTDEATSFPDMSLEEFVRFVDEVGPYLYQLVLYRGGESLINKNFLSMLEYAYERTGALLVLSSNMSHRLSYDTLRQIVRCCDLVDVTIDGLTPATYGSYRVRGNLDLAFSNLSKLARLASKPDANCHIRWRFIVFKENEGEVEEARRIADDMGVELQLVRAQVQRVAEGKNDLDLLPENRDLWRPEYSDTMPEINWSVRCGWLHGGGVLNHSMTLSPCCEMQRDFDSLERKTFLEAYNGEHYQNSRSGVACEGCAPPGRQEWDAIFDGMERRIAWFLLSSDLLFSDDRQWLQEREGGAWRRIAPSLLARNSRGE